MNVSSLQSLKVWSLRNTRGSSPAVEALFQGARGLPRQINRIAHYALSAAALDKARTVNADHLQHALEELRP